MHEAKRVHEWDQTGELVALIANTNRDPKRRRRPFSKAESVPRDIARYFRRNGGIRMTRKSLHALKPLFDSEG